MILKKFSSFTSVVLFTYLFTLIQCQSSRPITSPLPPLEQERDGKGALEADSVAPTPLRPQTSSGYSKLFKAYDKKEELLYQIQTTRPPFNTEAYDRLEDNPFLSATQNPLSTFSIDVDTASYSNLRRFIESGSLPPKDAVRIEELLNYFTYDYQPPTDGTPFATHVESASAPWATDHRLVKIGLKGKEIPQNNRPASNLVFLIDVSGSMEDPNKLPLVKKSLKMLVDNLSKKDRVAMVVYAGASGLALPSTNGNNKEKILGALDNLSAGGSTNGAQGIELAYKTAEENFIKGGTNRVILATDGDFNVGITNQGDLTRLIEEKAKSGIFLSVLGYGMGNYKDSTLEKLADKGNGNYAYIDTLNEARKVLVEQMGGTLVTIAKDVKIQVEFNPSLVAAYRLIGYENRMLRAEDFNNDKIDAGDIGAGHTVTALYEVVPVGVKIDTPSVDPLKYSAPSATSWTSPSHEMATVKLRYKEPTGSVSKLLSYPIQNSKEEIAQASPDFKFSAAVAEFGMILRDSPHKGNAKIEEAIKLAQEGMGNDSNGYRAELISLMHKSKPLLAQSEESKKTAQK